MQIKSISQVLNSKVSYHGNSPKDVKPVAGNSASTTNPGNVMSKEAANAAKAGANIIVQNMIPGIKPGTVEGKPSISVALNLPKTPRAQLPADVVDYKYGDITVSSKKQGDTREIKITKGDSIVEGFIKDGAKVKVEYRAAKFSPELVITREKGDITSSVKLIQGSAYSDLNDECAFVNTVKAKQSPSFKGNYVSLLCKKDATVSATNDAKKNSSVVSGAYYDEVNDVDPSFVVLAGGFGTRFANMTDADQNKPSWKMPNGNSFVSSAYDLILNAENKKGLGQVTYLEQNSSENPPVTNGLAAAGDEIVPMKAYASDGGAVIKAVLDGTIPDYKPLIILNADTITNVDLSDAFHRMAKYGDSALVIPRYMVSEERAKSFGLMCTEDQEVSADGHQQISEFIEKPKNPPKDAPKAMVTNPKTGENQFYGNPGIYMLSPAVLRNLKDLVLPAAKEVLQDKAEKKAKKEGKPVEPLPSDPDKLFSAETFLGNALIPAIVKLCNEGKLTDISGRPLKPYMVPMITPSGKDADWDDVGSAEAAISKIKDIAIETSKVGAGSSNKYYGIRNIRKLTNSVDLASGVVYASPVDKALYEETFGDDAIMQGNIYIKCEKK